MATAVPLRVVIVKPSKYGLDGCVERFRWGFMPNSTVAHLKSMTPAAVEGSPCEVYAVDEYVHTDLGYLALLARQPGMRTLFALVGVQSHQLHRALDLAALARERGVEAAVIGGPHPMTCDTAMLQGRGVAFAVAEAENVWPAILRDAAQGELRRYAAPLLGVYPARGCPYACNFCSVIKIAGRAVRSQPLATTLASLRAARDAGVRFILFTADNFNKTLLEAMIDEGLRLPFFAQCDTQVYKQEALVARMAAAGCFQMFVGAESFDREALREAAKHHNHPDLYRQIVELCRAHGITSHFSNILGFPSDSEATIREHLRALDGLDPDLASFDILTPIPGTEQYEDFLGAGLIDETNLDRFDGTAVTWRHPRLSGAALRKVAGRLARLARGRRDFRLAGSLFAVAGYSAQARWSALRREHPMAGGTGRVRRDREADYAALRRRRFGIARAPLPRSLALSAADEELNRRAKLAI